MDKLSPILITILEKVAHDCGFDIAGAVTPEWLAFNSSHCPLKIWMGSLGEGKIILAVSDSSAFDESLSAKKVSVELPIGANGAREFTSPENLRVDLRRCFQLSRSLPSEPLRVFETETHRLPKSTEVERMVVQRIGQDIFRDRLIDFWDGKCAVTGLAIPALLKASHIKPWSKCASDAERLDVFNGLLLAPHLDAVFDRGFVTFGDDGSLIVSKNLGNEGLKILGIDMAAKCDGLTSAHQKYLAWHRANEFQGK
jgi:putative restriction endonuclease